MDIILEHAFEECFMNKNPKRDIALYAFYKAIYSVNKAIVCSAASVNMELSGKEESDFSNYIKKKRNKLARIAKEFTKYIMEKNHYTYDGEFYSWLERIELAHKNEEYVESIEKGCAEIISKIVLNKE